MAPIKGPLYSAMPVVMVMMMVVKHSTGLCGCNWQCHSGERGQDESELFHGVLQVGLIDPN
jgi:hypothetical protein